MTQGAPSTSIKKKDVFISTRGVGVRVMAQLRKHLDEAGLTYYDWSDTGNTDSQFHNNATNRMIAACRGAIVLMGEDYFVPVPPSKTCAQKHEVEKILAQADGNDFPITLVILQDAAGFPNSYEFEKHVETHYSDLHMKKMQMKEIKNAKAEKPPTSWKPVLQRVAADMAEWIGSAEERKEDEPQPESDASAKLIPSPPPPAEAGRALWDAERFAIAERGYLNSAVEAWREGRGGGAGDKATASNPFSFHPGRFIVLKARELGSADSERAGDELRFVTDWLFRAEAHPPYAIRGPAGCGHTCTLSIAAAAMAAQIDSDLGSKCSEIPKLLLKGAEELARATKFLPVLIRARSLADIIRDTPKAPLAEALFTAVATSLASDGLDHASPAEMLARMRAQPYALFIDELDRLTADEESGVLRAMSDAYDAIRKEQSFKIIASGQPVSKERAGSVVDIELERPDTAQRTAFFDLYANTNRSIDKAALHQAAADLPLNAAAFDTPLLLNAFCWGVSQRKLRRDDNKGQVQFYEQITDLLLTATLKKSANLPDKPAITEILRKLAVAGLGGAIDEGAAEAIIAECGADAGVVLPFLVEKTNLLERRAGKQRDAFNLRGVFGDYLAAAHIASTHAAPGALSELSGAEAARSWRQAVAFACALLLQSGEDQALAFLESLHQRSQSSSNPADQAGWFQCVAAGLASLAAIRGDGTPARQKAIDTATATLARAQHWTPRQRSDAITELSTAVRHPHSPSKTRKAVNALCTRLLGIQQHWISIPNFKHPGGDASFKIAGLPLLVAQYAEYVADKEAGAHSLASDTTIVNSNADEGVSESGADIWAQISTMPIAPVVGLTFSEAENYCRWLTKKLRAKSSKLLAEDEFIRLPSDAEWDAIADAICSEASPYLWGDEDPREAEAARVNWRGANIGAATAPGTFAAYIATDLYDLGSNISIRTTPHRAEGKPIWPPKLAFGEKPEVRGANFTSRLSQLPYAGESATPPPNERWRTTGVRLVKSRCVTGWN